MAKKECAKCIHEAVCETAKACDGYGIGCKHFKEEKKGCWVGEADGYADGELVYDVWYCDNCNYCIDDGTDDPEQLPNYCPNCGADMRGEEE